MNRKLLDSVMADLQRSRGGNGVHESQLTQLLHRILSNAGLLREGQSLVKFMAVKRNAATLEVLKKKMTETEFVRPVERDFVQVLFHAYNDELRSEVVRFLSGMYLEKSECQRLGIPAMEEPESAEASEMRAAELLVAFGKAFAFAGLPLVLCFDQLENLSDPRQQREFGTMVTNIINEVPQALPICFTRPDFADKAVQQMDEHVWQRLFANRLQIEGCDKVEARDLIRARIEWAGEKSDPNRELRIDATLADLHSEINVPRKVLMEAGRHIGPNAKGADPLAKIAEFYTRELNLLLNAPEKTACRPDVLIGGLAEFLKARPQLPGGFQVRRMCRPKVQELIKEGAWKHPSRHQLAELQM